jgi:hypothetical protein
MLIFLYNKSETLIYNESNHSYHWDETIRQSVDTNSAFIALYRIGIEISEMISISDDKSHMILFKTQNTVDLVIVTGGLDPTKMM